MGSPTKPIDKIVYSEQEIQNQSFDTEFGVNVTESLVYDGQNLQRVNADNLADKIQVVGTDTYVGFAAPGTAQSAALWQAFKVDTDGTVTYADGNSNFDNIATDLSALTYS